MLDQNLLTLRSLERSGDPENVVRHFQNKKTERKGLSRRETASWARAAAFSGRASLALELLNSLSLSNFEKEAPDTLALWSLAQARLCRDEDQWEHAFTWSLKAEHAAGRTDPEDRESLIADALFAQAMALSEKGERYRAASLLERVRQQKDVYEYRRSLALMNEAWILLDLGNVDLCREIIREIPSQHRVRVENYLMLVDGNVDALKSYMKVETLTCLPTLERVLLLSLWTEAWAVYRDALESESSNLVLWWEQMRSEHSGDPLVQSLGESAVDLLEGRETLGHSGNEVKGQGSKLFLLTLRYLQRISKPKLAYDFWVENIYPFFKIQSIRPPLVPYYTEQQLVGEAPFHRMLRVCLGDTQSEGSRSVWILSGCTLISEAGRNATHFHRKSVTLTLLRHLVGRRGSIIAKERLFEAIWNFSYDPIRHEPRLNRILQRTAAQLRNKIGDEPWVSAGKGWIRLNITIELENENS